MNMIVLISVVCDEKWVNMNNVIKHEWFIKFPWNKKGKKESKTFL